MKSLKNKSIINELFEKGDKRYLTSPYRIMIIEMESDNKGYLIGVAKKNFKKAVDRNKIKRLIREGLKDKEPGKAIGIIYLGKTLPDKTIINQISNI